MKEEKKKVERKWNTHILDGSVMRERYFAQQQDPRHDSVNT